MLPIIRKTLIAFFVTISMVLSINAQDTKSVEVEVQLDGYCPVAYLVMEKSVKGDSKYLSIAASSILAKTYRDDYMHSLHSEHPEYDWANNKGYPTPAHRRAILELGPTSFHRKSFRLLPLH